MSPEPMNPQVPSSSFFPGTGVDELPDLAEFQFGSGAVSTAHMLRQSELVTKTLREAPGDEISQNSRLLTRAGYIQRLQSGIYTLLPLGHRVLSKIEEHVRAAMESLGSQEVMFSALQPRELLDRTGRWDIDVIFKLKGRGDRDLSLAFTHEEACAHVIGPMVGSYRQLPRSVFQIQTKFRDEPRAKSGLLRGKEFRMKDMYSFHRSQEDLDSYYDHAHKAYMDLYKLFGIGDRTYLTFASGGDYAPFSHEYQTLCDAGEDTIYVCQESGLAINREIFEKLDQTCPVSGGRNFVEARAIEVGNIFKLGTRFTDAYGFHYVDEAGIAQPIYMASYGVGLSRVLGTVAEILNDKAGLIWPASIAPYNVHIVSLAQTEEQHLAADKLYGLCGAMGFEVLYDDRRGVRAGEKFSDSDLIGIPTRIVVSPRNLESGVIEIKDRGTGEITTTTLENLENVLRK